MVQYEIAGDHSARTVLVVDDEPSLAKAASRLLSTIGFKVLTAADGQEAVELCRTYSEMIDVVLLDFYLPEMSSTETLRQMRSIHPGIKVILMSGHEKQESMGSFEGMQIDGFVPKPFGYAEIESALRAVLIA